MYNGSSLLPDQRDFQYAYRQAYDLSLQELASHNDIEGQCRRSNANYRSEGLKKTITLAYLNESYQITLPDVVIHRQSSHHPVSLCDKLLMLHYFLRAKGSPLSQRPITYKELPDGGSYYPTFYKRAVKPAVVRFGEHPKAFIKAAEQLGGRQVEYGDTAVTIDAFSRVPLTWILWKGDTELPAEGSILFDSTITDYLPTEDIAVLCQTVIWKLVKFSKQEEPLGD